MKRITIWLFLIIFLVGLPQVAAAGWVRYRLVKEGVIDQTRWDIDDSSAVITADEKRAKFELKPGVVEDSAWLIVNRCQERVKGLRVTIEMGANVTSRMYGRIGSMPGAIGPEKDALFAHLAVRKQTPEDDDDRVYGYIGAHDFFNFWDWLYDLNYTQFGHPIGDVAGKTFRLTMLYDNKKITFIVDGYGKSTYTLPEKAKPGYELFWAIGTRSQNDTGAGTVYFSDVELLVDGKCDDARPKVKSTYPVHKQKNVSVNLAEVWVKFNEPMRYRYSWNPPFACTNENRTDYVYNKRFVCTNDGQTLAHNTWYEVCLDKDGFIDFAGNGNKKYCFKFKTEKAPVIGD